MIRVNLLPVEKRKTPKAKGKGKERREIPFMTIIIGLLLAAIVSALCFWYFLLIEQKIQSVQMQSEQVRSDIAKLNVTIQDVESLESEINQLKQKIQIIENLQEAQTGPVLIMDELAKSLPQRVWIESFSENGTSIEIKGIGVNNLVVANFLENLEKSPKFQQVELSSSDSTTKAGYSGETLKKFMVSALLEDM
ncbi:MAG: PilN domain-containing protein [Candidatus Alcyoniella australis]|nr:PilN domain-containing protein [Candidatus Alcyoniella australis]